MKDQRNGQLSADARRLITQSQRFHPLYAGQMSNHLPMVLLALDRMGADGERLQSFHDQYRKKLQPLPPLGQRQPPVATEARPGRMEDYLIFWHQFHQAVGQRGVDAVLRQHLPELLPGVGAAGFHALIRLAYGVDGDNQEEIVSGLAFWSAAFLPLGPLDPPGDRDADALLAAADQEGPDVSEARGTIATKMQKVINKTDYRQLSAQPRELSMNALAATTARAYHKTGSFTLLHGVTGLHALRLVLPWLEDEALALRYFWQAYLAAYLTAKRKPKPPLAEPEPDWNVLKKRAIHSDDAHTIKLIYTCTRESDVYPDVDFRALAARRVD